ncbi:hypothetical protein ATANTOWER_018574, partial [Ataeniobius toweri]|nr:hypothetical protein [Ataeniobius toweri]
TRRAWYHSQNHWLSCGDHYYGCYGELVTPRRSSLLQFFSSEIRGCLSSLCKCSKCWLADG